ncbi:hypothetical protein [Dankookia sp. P2]
MPGNVTIPGLDFGLGDEIDMLPRQRSRLRRRACCAYRRRD